MKERWSDEELDFGLRSLFSQVRQPVAPPTLRIYPRSVVARPGRRSFGGLALNPRVRGLASVTATLALVLAVASVVVIIKPGSHVGAQASPSSSPSASASNGLPARVTSGGFVWTRLSLPTQPAEILESGAVMTRYGWNFSKAGGITFGVDCFGSVPGKIWTSTDDLNWTPGGLLPGAIAGDSICPSDVVWDGSRYVAFGGITHAAAPDLLLPAVWISTDAATWTRIALPANLPQIWVSNLAFGHGAYVAGIGDELWRTTDLTHWSKVQVVPSGSADGPALVVRFDGSTFVAADTGSTGNSFAYWSSDGLRWTRADLGGSILTLVARASGFVAVLRQSDYSTVAMGSANGYTWRQLGALPILSSQCNRDMLVCVQPGGMAEGWVYSSDGVSWRAVPWPAGLPSGNFAWGPSPDPMFITVHSDGSAAADIAVYVIQPQP
jgi:hypothetical protein